MRALILGAPTSIHVVRTINALADGGWDMHLFAAAHTDIHSDLRNATAHVDPLVVDQFGAPHPSVTVQAMSRNPHGRMLTDPERAAELNRVIREVQPDVMHTMETQLGAYLALLAVAEHGLELPPWIVGILGSDYYYYSRVHRHRLRLRAVMAAADYVISDNHRDLALSRTFGFHGRFLPVLATGGGYEREMVDRCRSGVPPSERRTVAARLQAEWAYRPRTVLAGLERCGSALEGYELAAYFLSPVLREEVDRVCSATGMTLTVVSDESRYASHEEILRTHGRARASLGAAITDGIPLSSLEAAMLGSLPIYSFQSAAGEWFRDRETALLVDGDDPETVAAAVSTMLADDDLVERAAQENAGLLNRLSRTREAARLRDAYERVLADQATRCASA